MIVTLHAVRRFKFHKLTPRTRDGHKVKEDIKRSIQSHTIAVYQNRRTGAMVKITPRFIAVMYGERVVTVYPNNQGQREKVIGELQQGRLPQFCDDDLPEMLQSQFVSEEA